VGLDRHSRRALRHIWILALAFIARFMPDTVKALSTSFLQIHRELEEAAWVCGKGMLGTIRNDRVAAGAAGVIASMTLLFVLAIANWARRCFSTPATPW